MNLLNTKNCFRIFFLFSLSNCFGVTLYEEPQNPNYSVGETLVESVVQNYPDFKIVSTATSVLEKIESFSGNNYNHWITTISTTAPTISTTSSRRFEDATGTFVVMNSDSSDNSGLAVYKTLKNNLGKWFEIGDTIIDTTSFFNTTILYDGVTSSGYGLTSVKGVLNAVENLNTNLGNLECYSIGISSETVIKFGNATNVSFNYSKSENGSLWLSNTYGRVKVSLQINELIEDDGFTEEASYSEERILVSAPSMSNIKGISSYSSDVLSNEANWNGWVWMGALPWVYNATTGSWGYFANQQLHLWNAADSSWLTFDQDAQSWVNSN